MRGHQHAIDEFVTWYCSEPRLAFNKTVALRYRFRLEERGLAPRTTNVRMAAVHHHFHMGDSGQIASVLPSCQPAADRKVVTFATAARPSLPT